jgi:hypothetical protein
MKFGDFIVLTLINMPMFTLNRLLNGWGVRGSVVVKALCYKPEGRGFETR